MSKTSRINIGIVKQYKNDFSNERSNFGGRTKSTFNNSYLNGCSDNVVVIMRNNLNNIYTQIENLYSDIDNWWSNYLNDLDGIERALSDNGGIGSIRESTIRNQISNLPKLQKYTPNFATFTYNKGIKLSELPFYVSNPYLDEQRKAIKDEASSYITDSRAINALETLNKATNKPTNRIYKESDIYRVEDLGTKLKIELNNGEIYVIDRTNNRIDDNNVNEEQKKKSKLYENFALDVYGIYGSDISSSKMNESNYTYEVTLTNGSKYIFDAMNKTLIDARDNKGASYSHKKDNIGELAGLLLPNHTVNFNLAYDSRVGNFKEIKEEYIKEKAAYDKELNELNDKIRQANIALNSAGNIVNKLGNNISETDFNTMETLYNNLLIAVDKGNIDDIQRNIDALNFMTNILTKELVSNAYEIQKENDIVTLGKDIGNKVKSVDWKNLDYKKVCATAQTATISAVEGAAKFGEGLADTCAIVRTAISTPKAWLLDVVGYNGGNNADKLWKDTMNKVSMDTTAIMFDDVCFNTEYGDYLKDVSYGFDTTRAIGNQVGYVGASMAFSMGTASTLGFGESAIKTVMPKILSITNGLASAGNSTGEAWANGADTVEGLIYGGARGAWDATQFYLGSKINNFNPIQTGSVGTTELYNALIHVGLDTVDSGVEGFVDPALRLIYKNTYRDENGNISSLDDKNIFEKYGALFTEAGGWSNVAQQAAMGGGMSALSEISGVAKAFRTEDKINLANENSKLGNKTKIKVKDMAEAKIVYKNSSSKDLLSFEIGNKTYDSNFIGDSLRKEILDQNIKDINVNGPTKDGITKIIEVNSELEALYAYKNLDNPSAVGIEGPPGTNYGALLNKYETVKNSIVNGEPTTLNIASLKEWKIFSNEFKDSNLISFEYNGHNYSYTDINIINHFNETGSGIINFSNFDTAKKYIDALKNPDKKHYEIGTYTYSADEIEKICLANMAAKNGETTKIRAKSIEMAKKMFASVDNPNYLKVLMDDGKFWDYTEITKYNDKFYFDTGYKTQRVVNGKTVVTSEVGISYEQFNDFFNAIDDNGMIIDANFKSPDNYFYKYSTTPNEMSNMAIMILTEHNFLDESDKIKLLNYIQNYHSSLDSKSIGLDQWVRTGLIDEMLDNYGKYYSSNSKFYDSGVFKYKGKTYDNEYELTKAILADSVNFFSESEFDLLKKYSCISDTAGGFNNGIRTCVNVDGVADYINKNYSYLLKKSKNNLSGDELEELLLKDTIFHESTHQVSNNNDIGFSGFCNYADEKTKGLNEATTEFITNMRKNSFYNETGVLSPNCGYIQGVETLYNMVQKGQISLDDLYMMYFNNDLDGFNNLLRNGTSKYNGMTEDELSKFHQLLYDTTIEQDKNSYNQLSELLVSLKKETFEPNISKHLVDEINIANEWNKNGKQYSIALSESDDISSVIKKLDNPKSVFFVYQGKVCSYDELMDITQNGKVIKQMDDVKFNGKDLDATAELFKTTELPKSKATDGVFDSPSNLKNEIKKLDNEISAENKIVKIGVKDYSDFQLNKHNYTMDAKYQVEIANKSIQNGKPATIKIDNVYEIYQILPEVQDLNMIKFDYRGIEITMDDFSKLTYKFNYFDQAYKFATTDATMGQKFEVNGTIYDSKEMEKIYLANMASEKGKTYTIKLDDINDASKYIFSVEDPKLLQFKVGDTYYSANNVFGSKFNNYDEFIEYYRDETEKWTSNLTQKQLHLIGNYIGESETSSYLTMNGLARGNLIDVDNNTLTFHHTFGGDQTYTFEEYGKKYGESVGDMIARTYDEIKELNRAITPLKFKEDTILYRGLSLGALKGYGVTLDDSAEDIMAKLGGFYTDNGFMSCAPNIGGGFIDKSVNLVINCKEGTSFGNFNKWNAKEQEVVLGLGTKCTVDKVEKNADKIVIYMTTIAQ